MDHKKPQVKVVEQSLGLAGRAIKYVRFHTGVTFDHAVHSHIDTNKHTNIEMMFITDGAILLKSLKTGAQRVVPFFGNVFELELA